MPESSTNTPEEEPDRPWAEARKPYEKPALSRLGSLRDMTMTKRTSGAKDGKNNRFTGRGGRQVTDG